MSFCSKCGKELNPNAQFCSACGTAVGYDNTERKTQYDGGVHKCPNCGGILDAYEIRCEDCGWERRNIEAANSTKKLVEQLNEIDAEQLPLKEETETKSVMKFIFGRDFKKSNSNLYIQRKEEFEKNKTQRKANLIRMFPIPNTKEDILEFLQLASSQVSGKSKSKDEVFQAWKIKVTQCEQKAKLLLVEDKDFKNLQDLNNKTEEKKKEGLVRNILIGIAVILLILAIVN